jgi:hypothetical protein
MGSKVVSVNNAISLLIILLDQASKLGAAISAARAEGRTDLTDAEVDAFAGSDDAARARLQGKIDALPSG